jgi:hypothetical protein
MSWLQALWPRPRPGLWYWRKRKEQKLDEVVLVLEELARELVVFTDKVEAQRDAVAKLRDEIEVLEEMDDRNHAAHGRD